MSLSDCLHCGGFIPLGPDATNCCEKCGRHAMSAPTDPTPTPDRPAVEPATDAEIAACRGLAYIYTPNVDRLIARIDAERARADTAFQLRDKAEARELDALNKAARYVVERDEAQAKLAECERERDECRRAIVTGAQERIDLTLARDAALADAARLRERMRSAIDYYEGNALISGRDLLNAVAAGEATTADVKEVRSDMQLAVNLLQIALATPAPTAPSETGVDRG